jgi:OmpA-OmpF porin, OOP family
MHPKISKLVLSIALLSALGLGGCAAKTEIVPEIEVVSLVKQPEFVVRKVYVNNPVVLVESTYQTVLCNGCEKVDAVQNSDEVLWLRLTPSQKEEFIVADKHFDFDKAILKGDLSKLRAIADRLMADQYLVLDVVGHTDSKGSAKYNIKLGQKRADAVKRWFVKQGIDAKRISASSRGESQPIASNSTKKGRAENRRAVITINVEP